MQFRIIVGLVTGCLLSGCAHIYGEHGLIKKRRNNEYLGAHSEPALQIPAGLDNRTIQSYYPVPNEKKTAINAPVSITPPGYNAERLPVQKRSFWGRVRDWF